MVNSVYAEALRVMAALAFPAGFANRAAPYTRLAEATEAAIITKCYDPLHDAFFSLSGRRERRICVLTTASLFPLLIEDLPTGLLESIVRRLTDPRQFWAPYPVPSISMSEPSFCAVAFDSLTWRGPTWMNVNWFLARGLRRHGRHDLAGEIARRSFALVEKSGFREYYNPLTGEGLGEGDFTWSALLLDMLTS